MGRAAKKIMKVKLFFIIFLVLLVNSATAQNLLWLSKMKEIVLLKSTRADVRRILGEPDDHKDDGLEYIGFEGGRFTVLYTTGTCLTKNENNRKVIYGWLVPEGTVQQISFTPNKALKPKKLPIRFEGFTSYKVSDVPDSIIYENDTLGIDYGTYKGKIDKITFRPANKLYNLKCKED
jgi:hypothetical protein